MFKNNTRYQIKTPTGFEYFHGIQKKIVDTLYTINLDDDTSIKCSGNHALLSDYGFILAKDLKVNDTITNKRITNIEYEIGNFEVFDPVGIDKHHSYFSNGVVSHNTFFLGSSNTLVSGKKLQEMSYIDPIAEHDGLRIYEYPIKEDDEKDNGEKIKKDQLYCITVDV